MQAALAAAALLWIYREAVLGYLRDQHYQEHFVYLWVFLGLALSRSLRGPFRGRFAATDRRDRLGLLVFAAGVLLYGASEVVGTSTGIRTSLVVCLTGIAVLVVPGWTVKRCLMHGLLMQVCFGVPYNAYFPLTAKLQWGVAELIAIPARLGLVDYTVEATVVQFPDYQLVITPDCSGFGQLLTFLGIVALGVLSSDRNRKRTIWLTLLAIALAWVSNVARVGMFVGFVALGWTWAVDDPNWHAGLGFLAFLPFVTLLVGVILRGHRPIPVVPPPPRAAGRLPVLLLFAPLLALHLSIGRGEEHDFPAPAYFAALDRPPGHQLVMRAPSEEVDRAAYVTPWLVNARFGDAEGRYFDLFHYATRSRSHLCVHKVAACLHQPDQRVRYAEPIDIDGRRWWRIALDRATPEDSAHVYFAFEVGGERVDDSVLTQLRVFRERLLGGSWEVRLWRVVFPGALPATPAAPERAVLAWLGGFSAL